LGGGFSRSVSVELGLEVNRSTREKTLVWRVALGAIIIEIVEEVGSFSFSFPRLVADENARKKRGDFFDVADIEGARDGLALLSPAAEC
jgi:hypothetical protein